MHEKHTYFCASSTIFLPFFIIRLTGSCHSLLLSHVTAFSSLSYRMKSTRRFLVHPGGTRLRAVPYRTARQHSTLHLLGRLFRSMHMLFSEAKSQVSHITVSKKPQSLERESKSWDHTYSKNWGKTTWRVWVTVLPDVSGISFWNPYRTCTTGQTWRPPGHPSFDLLAHSPAAA